MAQSCAGWREDAAITAVVAALGSWGDHDLGIFIRHLRIFGRPLTPRMAHTACCPQEYPYDIRSMRADGPPD
eukprot:12756234-Alexandrium_andersonii.AAC.1